VRRLDTMEQRMGSVDQQKQELERTCDEAAEGYEGEGKIRVAKLFSLLFY